MNDFVAVRLTHKLRDDKGLGSHAGDERKQRNNPGLIRVDNRKTVATLSVATGDLGRGVAGMSQEGVRG